jgi:hypothetical protein
MVKNENKWMSKDWNNYPYVRWAYKMKNKHSINDRFDFDGSGMLDNYIMFDIWDHIFKKNEIVFPRKYIAGETIATFKANDVYKKIGTCKCAGKCRCINPHYLGNFMPYPGGGSNSSHSTRRRKSSGRKRLGSLQELHNTVHNENPFKMLKDIENFYKAEHDDSEYVQAMKAADKDNEMCKKGFFEQFKTSDNSETSDKSKNFENFVEVLCFEDFIDSKWFTELKYGGGKWEYEDDKFDATNYYFDTMNCIKERTKKLLTKYPEIENILRDYVAMVHEE